MKVCFYDKKTDSLVAVEDWLDSPDLITIISVYMAKTYQSGRHRMPVNAHIKLLSNIDEIKRLESAIASTLHIKNSAWNDVKNNKNLRHREENNVVCVNAENEIAKANEKMVTLERDIFELRNSVSIDLVCEHQAVIDTTQTEINHLQKLITEQRQIITLASDRQDLMPDLMVQREELLTEIALGNDKSTELKQLDAQIKTVNTEQTKVFANNQKTIEHAQQTINGLAKRLSTAQEKLCYLQAYTPKIVDALLMAKATQAAIEFKAVANVLSEKITELVALDLFVATFGQRKNTGLLYQNWEVKIPCVDFNKPILYCEVPNGTHHILDSQAHQFVENSTQAINQLKQNLLEQGVML